MKAEDGGEREVNDHWLFFMSYVHRTVWMRLHEVCSMWVAWRLNVCFFIVSFGRKSVLTSNSTNAEQRDKEIDGHDSDMKQT